ncbi:MAG: hypothetical protein RLZZ254_225 [Actinomycetota bacterium]|jgi:hypothetical protein
MPIDKSSTWGETVELPPNVPTFSDESDLSLKMTSNGPFSIRMVGGDFVAITGGASQPGTLVRRYSCDALEVQGSDRNWWSIGTVELRRRRLRLLGGFVIVSNIGQRGSEQYSSRSHPNDAKFELVDASAGLTLRERFMLAQRLKSGADISHPRVKRRQDNQFVSDGRFHVFVDGTYRGRFVVTIEIRPDLLNVHV